MSLRSVWHSIEFPAPVKFLLLLEQRTAVDSDVELRDIVVRRDEGSSPKCSPIVTTVLLPKRVKSSMSALLLLMPISAAYPSCCEPSMPGLLCLIRVMSKVRTRKSSALDSCKAWLMFAGELLRIFKRQTAWPNGSSTLQTIALVAIVRQ